MLFCNGEWGLFCDISIPPSSYRTFFHLLILLTSKMLYEWIWSGTPAFIKYWYNEVWDSLLCGRGHIMTPPKSVTHTCKTLFPDAYLKPAILVLVYAITLNRNCLNIACIKWNCFVREIFKHLMDFWVLTLYSYLPHLCEFSGIYLGFLVECIQLIQFYPILIYPVGSEIIDLLGKFSNHPICKWGSSSD